MARTLNQYFIEGETERALIRVLQKSQHLKVGKITKFNFWEKPASKIVRMINKSDTLFVVFDTDVDCSISTKRFVSSINLLLNNCKVLYLLAQHPNLEGELVYACSLKNQKELIKQFYSTTSLATFKRKLLEDSSFQSKLENNGFNFKKIWSRNNVFKNRLLLLDSKKYKTLN